jgi:hypothetical protein
MHAYVRANRSKPIYRRRVVCMACSACMHACSN